MIDRLLSLMSSRWYWLGLIALALVLEGVALFYQHLLNEPPCVICIHARLWTLGILLAGGIGAVFVRHWWGPAAGAGRIDRQPGRSLGALLGGPAH